MKFRISVVEGGKRLSTIATFPTNFDALNWALEQYPEALRVSVIKITKE